MKKVLLIGGLVIVAIVIAVAYTLYTSLDSIIEAGIEKYGSFYTGTEVQVGGVELDLVSGKGAITGFSVANPAGFETDTAMEVGKVAIDIDINTITENPIVVKEVRIDQPKVTYEIGSGGNNIDTIADTVKSKTGSGGGAPADQAGAGESGGGTKMIIEDLYVSGGTVGVSATALKGKTMTTDLEDIHLQNIGKEGGGASAGQVAAIISASLFKWVGVALEDVDLGDVMKVIGDNTEGVPMKAKEAGEAVGKEAGEAADKLKKLIK